MEQDAKRTTIARGKIVYKDFLLLDTIGTIDECQAVVQFTIAYVRKTNYYWLNILNNNLYLISSIISGSVKETKINKSDLDSFEFILKQTTDTLPKINKFVSFHLNLDAAQINILRTHIRKVERKLVELSHIETIDDSIIKFINIASSIAYLLAREITLRQNTYEEFFEVKHNEKTNSTEIYTVHEPFRV